MRCGDLARCRQTHSISLQSVIRRVMLRFGGAEGRPACGVAAGGGWIFARVDGLSRSSRLWPSNCFAGSGFVTKTGRLARFVGCVCPDMQNRADGHRRREHQPAFGTRCISWHAQTVETATETAKCCGIKRVVYVRAYTTRRIICVAAVPCLLSRILCAAAWAT